MKKNFLLLLFAALLGVVSASADMVRINVDNAANVIVTTANGANTLTLVDGMNSFDLSTSDNPLAVQAADGAEIVEVTKNNEPVMASGYGTPVYRMAIEPMMVNITTSGSTVEKNYNIWFQPTFLGSISVTCNGEKTVIADQQYYQFPADAELVIAPEEGYEIVSVSADSATDNGNGTWTVKNSRDYGYVDVKVAEKGIHFTAEVNVAANIAIIATLQEDSGSGDAVVKEIDLSGNGPYDGTAPDGTLYLNFWPAAGGTINSITRVAADGSVTALVNSAYVGWRSTVAEGDNFIFDVTGPEVELTFAGARGFSVSDFVINTGKTKLNVTTENPTAKVRVGETIAVAGANGTTLSGLYAAATTCETLFDKYGVTFAKVTGAGSVSLYGMTKTGMDISVDNASAVTVTGGAGNGAAISLTTGTNTIESVQNPLKIAATAGYRIESVYADGVSLAPNADGTYNAELLQDGTVVIFTAELPKPLPITFSVTGDASKLIITKDGQTVEFSEMLEIQPGTEITVGVQEGWLIKELSLTGNESVTYDEETGIYTFAPRHATTVIINVEKWVAAPGNALVTFTTDMPRVSAFLYDAEGERIGSLKVGINEVKIGSQVTVQIFGDLYLKEVLVNGKALDIAVDAKTATFTVEGETTLEVSTYELCHISGYKTSNPDNHSFLGYIYINEVGQSSASVPAGGSFTVLPTPERGYKFAGFSFVYPEEIKDQIGDEIKDSYTITVPDGVNSIIFEGKFESDNGEVVYTVRGSNCFVDSWENISDDYIVYINVDGALLIEYNAFEGDTVHLATTGRDASKPAKIETYCLYYHNQKPISADYVVNPEDANADNVIYVSAYINTQTGVEGVTVDGELSYDHASKILTAPAAVKVFSTSGRLVLTAEAGEVSLETLPAGMYIATTGSSTIKIVK